MSKLLFIGEALNGPVNTPILVETGKLDQALALFGNSDYIKTVLSPQGSTVIFDQPCETNKVIFHSSVDSKMYEVFGSLASSGSIVIPPVPLTSSQVGYLEYIPTHQKYTLGSVILQAFYQSSLTPIESFEVLRVAPQNTTRSSLTFPNVTFKYLYPSVYGNKVQVSIFTDRLLIKENITENSYYYSNYANLGHLSDILDLGLDSCNVRLDISSLDRYLDVYSTFSAVTGTYILTGSISSVTPLTGYGMALADLDLEQYDIIAFPGHFGREIFPQLSYFINDSYPTLFIASASGTTLTSISSDLFQHRQFICTYGTCFPYETITEKDLVACVATAIASDNDYYAMGSLSPLAVTSAVTPVKVVSEYGLTAAKKKNGKYLIEKTVSTDLTAKPYVTSVIRKFYTQVRDQMISLIGLPATEALKIAETTLESILKSMLGGKSPVISYSGQVTGNQSELNINASFVVAGIVEQVNVSTTVPIRLAGSV